MIYRIVNSKKMRVKKTLLSCILIITILVTFSSCATTEIIPRKAENVEYGSPAVITKIILNNKLSIDCRNTFIRIDREADQSGIFTIIYTDTLKESNNVYVYKTKWNELRIPERDIYKVYMEDQEVSVSSAVFIILGLLTIAALLIGIGISQSGFSLR